LCSHQALVARWQHVANVFLAVTLAVTPIILAVVAYVVTHDIALVVIIALITGIAAFAIWIIGRDSRAPRPGHLPRPFPAQATPDGRRPWFSSAGHSPFDRNVKSEAETIQDMITLREKRLAELKQNPSFR
jgi:hypothetical protein